MALTREAKVAEFLSSPLVKWIRTFEDLAPCDSLSALADAELLNRIMQEVDPASVILAKVNKKVNGDRMRRAQNLHYILEGIQNFYAATLEQVVIMRLPDLLAICKDPDNDESLYEMEKMLLLLLGCSVQCENKETMIQQIQRLETPVQHAVVSHIKEVTDNPDNVYAFEWEDIEAMSKAQLEAECRRMYLYLQKVAKERDEYHLARIDLSHERDFYMEQFSMVTNVKRTPSRTPSFLRSPPDQSELETQQITDLKRKLRLQQEQLDSKVVQLQEVQEDLEKLKEQVHRLHSEKRQLSKDAQKVRVYKDEVEMLRAKASEVEQLLTENKKLRNMVEDVDYLKKKVQDLKEQNLLVQESKQLLEEELSSLSLQQNLLTEKKGEIAKLKMQVDALQAAKDTDLQQIQELIEANTRLEFEKIHGAEEIALLQREAEDLKGQLAIKNGEDLKSCMENELSEAEISARMKLLRLERDNQQLEKSVEESKHASTAVAALENKNKELQQQTQEASKQIAELQEELKSEKLKSQELDDDRAKLQKELQRLPVNTEQQLSGFKLREKEKFTTLEARFDAALNRSVSCSEDRISVLESRLEEANQTNQDLDHELNALRQENLRLKAAANLALHQTDVSSGSHGHVSPTDSGSSGGCSDEVSPSIERRLFDADYQPDRTESPQMRHGRLSVSEYARHPYIVQVKEGLSPSEFVRLQEKREVGYLQDKVLDLRAEKSALEIEIKELKSRLHRIEQDRADVELRQKTEVANKDSDIRSMQRRVQDLEVFRVELEIRRNEVNQLNRDLAQNRRRLQEAESRKAELEIYQRSMSSAKTIEAKSLKRQLEDVLVSKRELETAQETLVEKCSMLEQMNKTLELENKHMLAQLSKLVVQNQDLMTQNMDSKDRFHEEEKQFQEKLNEMENEKQRLGGKLEQLEAERSKKKKSFFRKIKGKLKGGKQGGNKTDGGRIASIALHSDQLTVGSASLSASNPSLMRPESNFLGLPEVGSQPGTRASISYGPTEHSIRTINDGYLSPEREAPRSRYSIATATPSDKGYRSDAMVSMGDFLVESDKTPRSRKQYVEETLHSMQTPYRERGATVGSGRPIQELIPRRELYPGESPPSFLATPRRKTNDPGMYLPASANRGQNSSLGRLPREISAGALLSGQRRSPKARRRMQSTDALLGGQVVSPSLQENELHVFDDDDLRTEKNRTLPRRRQKTAEAMLGLEDMESQGLRNTTSQEQLPLDGVPSDEPNLKGGTSSSYRSQAQATLVAWQPSNQPAAQGTNSGDVRQASAASSDADSGFAPPPQLSPSANQNRSPRFQSPVGDDMRRPTYQSTPMRPQHPDARSSSEEEAILTHASSGVDLVASNSSSNRSITDKGGIRPPSPQTNNTTNEAGMDASGWYEYGCV